MKTRLILMLAMLAIAQPAGSRRALAAVQAPERAAPSGDVLPICEKALEAAIEGHDAFAVVKGATKDMPPNQQQAVIAICGVYLAGAVSMLKHAAQAPKVPAGGTTI